MDQNQCKCTWINDFTDSQENEILALMKNEWWCNKRTLPDIRKMLANRNITIGAVDERDILVAFARVLTDFTYKALIFDVSVKPREFRKQVHRL